MAHMESNLASRLRVNVSGGKAATLAGEAVAVENFRAELRGDNAFEFERFSRRLLSQQVLAGLQVGTIIVCEDYPTYCSRSSTHSAL
jgi:hypothetical protein